MRSVIAVGLCLLVPATSFAQDVPPAISADQDKPVVHRIVRGVVTLENGSDVEMGQGACLNQPAVDGIYTTLVSCKSETARLVKMVNDGVDKANGTVSAVVPIVTGLAGLVLGIVVTGAVVAATQKH